MAKTKKSKFEVVPVDEKTIEQVVTDAVKQKKYQRSVKVRFAGEIAKLLVYSAKNFRGRYEGDSLYSFKVAQEDKSFLDEILDRLEVEKK